MKIVIDIPESAYEAYKEWDKSGIATVEQTIIAHGTPFEITEEQAIDKLQETGWLIKHDKEMTEEPHGKWIPVSERLPEKSGRYFVTRGLNACGAMWNRTYIVNYSDLMGLKSEKIWWVGNVGKSDFERIDDVIAWQPLPEPYKKGANK